ncbi:unnamed protein product [Owenia fusiformis]|uniref:Uncharacterized protein n=1 Tax=Owenia fusiformis TaxID=6347 RepID=A0A8J1XJT8_OWEFU|nr:unnamed protein product [Owenia fusiformis]
MAQSKWTVMSYILMVVFLAMFGTIGLTRWITTDKSHGVTETVLLVMSLMLQVTTVMCLFVFTRVNKTQWRYVPWRLSDTHGIAFICLTVFLVGTFIYDLFRIIATAECLNVYKHFKKLYEEKIINLVLLILEPLIYMPSQLLFLMWCNYGNIQNNPNIEKSYVFMLASGTNMFLWIYSFLFNCKNIFPEQNKYNTTMLDPAIQKHANECLHGETALQTTADNVEIYLYPVQMEFCILATSLLLHTWSHIKHSHMNMYAEMIDFPDDIGDGGPNDDVNRQHALIGRNNDANNEVNENNDVIGANDANPQEGHHVNCYGLLWIVGILFMTLMFTFEGLLYVQTFYSKAIYIVTWIKTIYDLALIMVCTYVLYRLKKSGQMRQYGNIDTKSVILLISSLGLFINAAFLYVSVIPTLIYKTTDPFWADKCSDFNIIHDMSYYDESYQEFLIISVLSLIRHTFKIIQVIQQVYLIIMLSSFYIGPTDNWLSECLGFVLILNFGHWLADSIVEVKLSNASPVQEHFFGCNNWLIMVHLFFPLSIYFRFHSVLMLSEHIRHTRHQHYSGYQPLNGDNIQNHEQLGNNNDQD